jgi:ABC-type bacteriocin/lantibiotic exporter with double-glycine peptidase domain
MRLIKQRTKTDCGVACLAMLAGVSWAKARDALEFTRLDKSFWTTKDSMRCALQKLGVDTTKNLVRCKYPQNLRKDALLKTNVLKNGNWHWAVWDHKRQKLLDPYYMRTRPVSALVVVRRRSKRRMGCSFAPHRLSR